jgi:hypothetical protein
MSEILIEESKCDWTNRVAVAVDAVKQVISALTVEKKNKSKESAKAAVASKSTRTPKQASAKGASAASSTNTPSDGLIVSEMGPSGGLCDLITADDLEEEEDGSESQPICLFME